MSSAAVTSWLDWSPEAYGEGTDKTDTSSDTPGSVGNVGSSPIGIQPNERAIWSALMGGRSIKVQSYALGEEVYWVRDDRVRSRITDEATRNRTYTLEELRWMLKSGWTHTELRSAHMFKQELGGKLRPVIEGKESVHG